VVVWHLEWYTSRVTSECILGQRGRIACAMGISWCTGRSACQGAHSTRDHDSNQPAILLLIKSFEHVPTVPSSNLSSRSIENLQPSIYLYLNPPFPVNFPSIYATPTHLLVHISSLYQAPSFRSPPVFYVSHVDSPKRVQKTVNMHVSSFRHSGLTIPCQVAVSGAESWTETFWLCASVACTSQWGSPHQNLF
jgi:hypothetical protein